MKKLIEAYGFGGMGSREFQLIDQIKHIVDESSMDRISREQVMDLLGQLQTLLEPKASED